MFQEPLPAGKWNKLDRRVEKFVLNNINEVNVANGIGNTFIVFGKIILFVCYIIYWKSRLLKSKKDALIMDTFVRFIAFFAFILQFSWAGAVYNIFCIIRNFRAEYKRGWPKDLKQRECFILLVIFLVVFFMIMLPKSDSPFLLLIMGIFAAINLYGTVAANGMQGMLKFNLIALPLSLFLCWQSGAISILFLEIISLIIYIIGYLRNKENETDL